jgi:uncharacterized membrane-anchored protein
MLIFCLRLLFRGNDIFGGRIMLIRKLIITGFVALGLMALVPAAVHAEDKQDAPAASADQPAASDSAADKPADEAAKPDDDKAAAAAGDDEKALDDVIKAAMVRGPTKVDLGDQATVDLSKDFGFVPKEQGIKIMQAMGNHPDEEGFYGLFFPLDRNQRWFVSATFDDSGFIKDDDQKSIDADEILSQIKKGVAEDNTEHKDEPQMEIVGWIEKPHYDAKSHHLIWSIEGKEIGSTETDNLINYDTRALGRGGYISLKLITTHSQVETDKKAVAQILDNLQFKDGKKYENFDPKSDKVAEYGLMALIGGIALKKAGLFAVAAAFAVKGAKVLVVAALAGVAAVKKFFKRRDPTV